MTTLATAGATRQVSQASALVDAGVRDVLIANEVVGEHKIGKLVELAKRVDALCVACDNPGAHPCPSRSRLTSVV